MSEVHVKRFKVQRSWNQEIEGGIRIEVHAQRQTVRHQTVESLGALGVPSTSGEARSDPLQSARSDSLQEAGGVADSSEADRDAVGSKGRFLFLEDVW